MLERSGSLAAIASTMSAARSSPSTTSGMPATPSMLNLTRAPSAGTRVSSQHPRSRCQNPRPAKGMTERMPRRYHRGYGHRPDVRNAAPETATRARSATRPTASASTASGTTSCRSCARCRRGRSSSRASCSRSRSSRSSPSSSRYERSLYLVLVVLAALRDARVARPRDPAPPAERPAAQGPRGAHREPAPAHPAGGRVAARRGRHEPHLRRHREPRDRAGVRLAIALAVLVVFWAVVPRLGRRGDAIGSAPEGGRAPSRRPSRIGWWHAHRHLERQLDPHPRRPRRRLDGARRRRRARDAGDQVQARAVPDRGVRGGRLRASRSTASTSGTASRSRAATPIGDVETEFPGMPGFVKGARGPRPARRRRGRSARRSSGVRLWSLYVPNGRALGDPHYVYKLDWLAALTAVHARRDLRAPRRARSRSWATSTSRRSTTTTATPRSSTGSRRTSRPPERAGVLRASRTRASPTSCARACPRATRTGTTSSCEFPRNEGMRIDFILGSHGVRRRRDGCLDPPQRAQGRRPERPRAGARRPRPRRVPTTTCPMIFG